MSELSIIDIATYSVDATLAIGGGQDVVVSPDGSKAYIITFDDSTVSVLDTVTNLITNTIPIAAPEDGAGVGIDITPDGNKVYAVDDINSNLVSIDTATLATTTINLGVDIFPTIVAISPDGSRAFVVNGYSDDETEVAVIDTASDALLNTISISDTFFAYSLAVVDRGFTDTGSDVEIHPTGNIDITFNNVTTSGDTIVSATSTAPALPEGFKLNNDSLFFEITTSASFVGQVEICISYTDETDEGNLKFLHEENGNWKNRTTSLDTVNNIICGRVNSFSLFAVALLDVILVDIDIRPGDELACLHNNSKGVIPVAIFGNESIDVAQINPSSLELNTLILKQTGKRGKFLFHITDLNGDGRDDVMAQFSNTGIVFSKGLAEATLTGSLLDGTRIQGSETICVN